MSLALADNGLEQTVHVLRDALIRVSAERGVDSSATIIEVDRILGTARSDPGQAAVRVNEAYVLLRSQLARLPQAPTGAVTTSVETNAQKADEHRISYERVRSSAGALRDALSRIAVEAKNPLAMAQLAVVDTKFSEADALVERGDWLAGKALAQQAFELAKLGIRGLREGTTQVRSLAFANAEEEYQYELSRHASYRKLQAMLVTESTAEQGKSADAFDAQATALSRDAEVKAAAGDFEAAVKLMEQATSEIVRAIRSAGVFLPG